MNGIATLTTKGQIVIPQSIRDFFDLRASDRLHFKVEKGRIIAQPIISVEEALGMVKSLGFISKKDHKKTIAKKVLSKF